MLQKDLIILSACAGPKTQIIPFIEEFNPFTIYRRALSCRADYNGLLLNWTDLPGARPTPYGCPPSWLRLGERAGCWGLRPWRNRGWGGVSRSFWTPQNHGSLGGTVRKDSKVTNTDDDNDKKAFCTREMIIESCYTAQIRSSRSGLCRAIVRHHTDWKAYCSSESI